MSSYEPKFQYQLGHGTPVPGKTTGSMDCGVRSASMGMDGQSRGRLKPNMDTLRKKMGTPGAQTTNVWDVQKGVEKYKGDSKYKPMRAYVKRSIADVKDAVSSNKSVLVCIDYGAWNKSGPQQTGDPNFKGGHSILIKGQRRNDKGEIKYLVHDPLEDARRSSIPQGPRWIHRQMVLDAMVAFSPTKSGSSIYAVVFGGGQAK